MLHIVYLPPWEEHVTSQAFHMLATSRSSCLTCVMALISWIDVIFWGILSESLQIIWWQRAGELTQPWSKNINKCLCVTHVNPNCFWSPYLARLEKSALTKSTTAYHGNMRLYKSDVAMTLCRAQQLWTGLLLVGACSGLYSSHSPGSIVNVQSLSHPNLCDTMDYSTPGFHVFHHLLELTQTHVSEFVLPSNHLILCRPLLLHSILLNIRVFSNESALCVRWPKYSNTDALASVLPMNIQELFPLGLTGWINAFLQEPCWQIRHRWERDHPSIL